MIKLETKNGTVVPEVGLGTFGLTAEAFSKAIEVGYRLIDTSDDYRNEMMIGQQLESLYKKSIISREDLFIQTKVSDDASFCDDPLNGVFFWKNSPLMQRHSVEEVMREKIQTSKRRLKTDYLDSVLLHFPYPDYFVEMWDVLCRIKEEEHIRYIGVSNFSERHFKALSKKCEKPSINQTYFSPIGCRQGISDYCNMNEILMMTYSPLMDYHRKMINYPIITDCAGKYGKSPSQIILRWNIERGSIPCPKSNNSIRLRSNFDILDFKLEQQEVIAISNLNYNYQYLPESKYCPGI